MPALAGQCLAEVSSVGGGVGIEFDRCPACRFGLEIPSLAGQGMAERIVVSGVARVK